MLRCRASVAGQGWRSLDVPPDRPGCFPKLLPAALQRTDPGGKLKRALSCMPTRGLACPLHPSVLPPRSQRTQAKRKSENLHEEGLERVSTSRGMPRGPGTPRLFRCVTAWRCQALLRGGLTPPSRWRSTR